MVIAIMRQLTMTSPRDLEWLEVPEPDLRSDVEALVRPLAVATCDLDGAIVRGETPMPGPIALGHEGIAEVLAVGETVTSVKPGDQVVVPFQVSCSECDRCRRGLTGNCERAGDLAMFGFGALGGDWGGFLSDVVRIPYADAMLVPAPPDVDPRVIASASDNIPDGYRTVAPFLAERPGADVLVLGGGGGGSIALYATGIAVALGAGRVTYYDRDERRLGIASDLGAEAIDADPPHRADDRYPIVVDAGASPASLACACRSTAPGGDCTHVGIIYEPETPVPLLEMYSTGMSLHAGRVMARATMPAVLDLVAGGRLDPSVVTDRVVAWDDAAPALLEPHTKLVFAR
jgi:alcohol dehydrogenase